MAAARSIENGPAADYPVIIGDPFTIGGVTYTPEDTMNYDRVGFVGAEETGAAGVTGAHRTLPLPSYVEVTSLNSGRTILVRLERRGPMTNNRLIALSPDALHQLGASDGAPVRVRRVNPPEEQRADLRSGGEAPLRMDTPEGLLEVLRRRLPDSGSVALGDPRQQEVSGTLPPSDGRKEIASAEPGAPSSTRAPVTNENAVAGPSEPESVNPTSAEEGKFAIQVGTFAVRENAERLAKKVAGFVQTSGQFALVRTGPYSTRGQADEALAKLRSEGYSDAEIRTLD